jgi:hypothetical protein
VLRLSLYGSSALVIASGKHRRVQNHPQRFGTTSADCQITFASRRLELRLLYHSDDGIFLATFTQSAA